MNVFFRNNFSTTIFLGGKLNRNLYLTGRARFFILEKRNHSGIWCDINGFLKMALLLKLISHLSFIIKSFNHERLRFFGRDKSLIKDCLLNTRWSEIYQKLDKLVEPL